MRVVLLVLVVPLIGCGTGDSAFPDGVEQVSQGMEAAPGFVCSEAVVTVVEQGESSSIACRRVDLVEPLF